MDKCKNNLSCLHCIVVFFFRITYPITINRSISTANYKYVIITFIDHLLYIFYLIHISRWKQLHTGR